MSSVIFEHDPALINRSFENEEAVTTIHCSQALKGMTRHSRVPQHVGVGKQPLTHALTPKHPRLHLHADPRPLSKPKLYVGCAGWTVPKAASAHFPESGSHLERYAQVFNGVEINSSFYRPHRPATYARWAASVPDDFRFAVKMPRSVSHHARLFDCITPLQAFLDEVHQLGSKLGCLLLQLPPSLAYAAPVALPFFGALRRLHQGPVACEPRHASWFALGVNRQLKDHGISRVAADPALLPKAAVPAGDPATQYLRLHGSPRIYHDSYPAATLRRIALKLRRPASDTSQRWCIFDNTALGHATSNALDMLHDLANDQPSV